MFIYFKLFIPLLEISMHKDAYRSILIAAPKNICIFKNNSSPHIQNIDERNEDLNKSKYISFFFNKLIEFILQLIWKYKGPRIPNNLRKEKQKGHRALFLKTYYKL